MSTDLNPTPSSGTNTSTALTSVHPVLQFLIAFGLVVVGTFFFSVIGILIGVASYHLNIFGNPDIINQLDSPGVIPVLKLTQALSAIGGFIVPALIFARIADRRPFQYLGMNVNPGIKWALMGILVIVFFLPLINTMAELNSQLKLPSSMAGVEHWMQTSEEQNGRVIKAFMDVDGFAGLLGNLVVIALLAAIGEELIFRGVMQRIFRNWFKNYHVAVWVTAVIFSAIHVQFYGFLPRMVLGALLGYLFIWSGSIWVPILAHFTNNAFGVIAGYLSRHAVTPGQLDSIGSSKGDWMYVAISFIFTGVLIGMAYKMRTRPAEAVPESLPEGFPE